TLLPATGDRQHPLTTPGSRPPHHRGNGGAHARADLRFGTFLPFRRASERPMAMACLRPLTVLPLRPLLSVPFLRLCMALRTTLEAPREYRRAIWFFLHSFHANVQRALGVPSSATIAAFASEPSSSALFSTAPRRGPGRLAARDTPADDERCGTAEGMSYRCVQKSEIPRPCGFCNGAGLRPSPARSSCWRCCSRSNAIGRWRLSPSLCQCRARALLSPFLPSTTFTAT